MKVYINHINIDEAVTEMTVDDKFYMLADRTEDEGLPYYEKLARELRKQIKQTVKNGFEVYLDKHNAECSYDPFLSL